MTRWEFDTRLAERAGSLGLAIQISAAERLWVYFELLSKWNRKINLTAIDLVELPVEGFDRLFMEPLAAARHAAGVRSLIDIGSGGGSPALPLAAALDSPRLTMVEVKTRKSVFLREAAREMGLLDAVVVRARYEALVGNPNFHEAYDLLSVRAVSVAGRVFGAIETFVRPGGRLLHFRSVHDAHPALLPPLALESVEPLTESSRSELAIISKR